MKLENTAAFRAFCNSRIRIVEETESGPAERIIPALVTDTNSERNQIGAANGWSVSVVFKSSEYLFGRLPTIGTKIWCLDDYRGELTVQKSWILGGLTHLACSANEVGL